MRASLQVLSIVILFEVGAAIGAEARSTTGYNSFKIQNPGDATKAGFPNGPFAGENPPVSVNINLLFDLVIDHEGTHNIDIHNYWGGPPSGEYTPFSCTPYSYRGQSSSAEAMGSTVTFTQPQTDFTTNVNVGHSSMGMTIICWGVPAGEGISIINWDD